MPSCVVKGCRNYSRAIKKVDGITYHCFPRDMKLKYQWINAIRQNRKDPSWMPSMFSHVCSEHFDETDFHTTKKGYHRLNKLRCPRKGLQYNETSGIRTIVNNEMASSRDSASSGHLQISKDNDSFPPNVVFVDPTTLNTSLSTNDQSSTAHKEIAYFTDTLSAGVKVETDQTSTDHDGIAHFTGTLRESVKVETDPENVDVGTAATSDSTCHYIAVYTHHTLERTPSPLPMNEEEEARYDTPIRHILRQKLKRKEKLCLKRAKNIKTLHQKVRRLEKRNKILKSQIKRLKICNFMYPEMQDALNNTVLDIMKNLKRKTHYKKTVICTPAMKQFCGTLDHFSPKAYAYVRNTFHNCLPHRKTLVAWCRPKDTYTSASDHGELSQ